MNDSYQKSIKAAVYLGLWAGMLMVGIAAGMYLLSWMFTRRLVSDTAFLVGIANVHTND